MEETDNVKSDMHPTNKIFVLNTAPEREYPFGKS